MNVGELREIIKNLRDDMPVNGKGHFGEALEVWSIAVQKVNFAGFFDKPDEQDALVIDMEDPGPEPD